MPSCRCLPKHLFDPAVVTESHFAQPATSLRRRATVNFSPAFNETGLFSPSRQSPARSPRCVGGCGPALRASVETRGDAKNRAASRSNSACASRNTASFISPDVTTRASWRGNVAGRLSVTRRASALSMVTGIVMNSGLERAVLLVVIDSS